MTKKLLYLFILALIAGCIEVDISVPSLPDISDYFGISNGLTQMTIAVNFLGFCISSAIYGPLAENFGRRKIMLFGNALMLIGAFGCIVSNSIELLLISRFIQGVGASASAVVVFVMIADVCNGKEAADTIGKMNSMLSIIMSIAPIAGGIINELIGWRGNYTVVFIVSVVSLASLYLALPETKEQLEPFNGTKIIKDYCRLLTSGRFMLASLVPSLMFAGYMSFIACGSFLYMETYKLPIMQYVFHQGSIIACFSFVSQSSAVICDHLGEKKSVIYGIYMLMLAAIILFVVAGLGIDNAYIVTLTMNIGSFGAAITYPLVFAKSFEIFPDIKGTTSSAIMSIRMLVTASAVAIISLIYDGSLIRIAIVILAANTLSTVFVLYLVKLIKFAEKGEKI